MSEEIRNSVSLKARNWVLKAKDGINRKINPYSNAVTQFITNRYEQLNQPINLAWRTIAIEDNGEQLVEISNLDKRISYNKECYKLIYPYSINKCFVRKTVAIKLKQLIEKLSSNYHLLIFDAWRPIKLQEYLFQNYQKQHPNLDENEVSTFISNPYHANQFPPPHYTGGAIDIAFSNYEKEFWHFDYGNQFWAKSQNKEKALYGGIEPTTARNI